MLLKIYTLKGIEFAGPILSLNVMTEAGEITILDHHRSLVSILKKGEIKIVDETKQTKVIMVSSGFLEVCPGNLVNILANL